MHENRKPQWRRVSEGYAPPVWHILDEAFPASWRLVLCCRQIPEDAARPPRHCDGPPLVELVNVCATCARQQMERQAGPKRGGQ